jgi:hypothetical protein
MKSALKITLLCGLAALARPLAAPGPQPNAYAGTAACAKCHAEIYKTFVATPMAQSSGTVGAGDFGENLAGGEFTHAKSGVTYQVTREGDAMYLDFARGPSEKSPAGMRGRRRLDFFIGSGNHGRSYVSALDDFLFQAPVAYYAREQKWDMSPGYEVGELMKLSRPIQQGCLECHASSLRPVAGSENRYEPRPFLENGISCERCHGPGAAHVAAMRAGGGAGGSQIVNPAKLAPTRRESVCAQCHLSGEARIDRPRRSLLTFRPGDPLSDHVVSFLQPAAQTEKLKATGHIETLARSRCRQASGDQLTCTTCHDPHRRPARADATRYFNQKCASCHQAGACKVTPQLREQAGNNCVSCHMPKSPTQDIAHNVFTDHSIPRAAGVRPAAPAEGATTLVPYWGGAARPRDLGMAYLAVASRTTDASYARAAELLKKAEPELGDDAQALTFLGKIYEREKNYERAARCYEGALKADPARTEAGVNLGTIYARGGRLYEAIKLWEDVLARNPGYEIARLNLAVAHMENGNFAVARQTLLKALEYDPDLPVARKILADLDAMK